MKHLPLIISLILHAAFLILAFLATPTSEEEGADKPPTSSEQDIVPKQVQVDFVQPQDPEQGDILEPKKPKKVTEGLTECKDDQWFGGIGIYQNGLSRVEAVIEGYPAHKAGILAGDNIASTYGQEIRGEPGTSITISVIRGLDHEWLTFTMIRDRICTEDKI